ncbi:MAG: hypothetical protein MJY99_09240 [Fibrobacter sp.]|nr:hypothetical protein [Fibrobacter sp.]
MPAAKSSEKGKIKWLRPDAKSQVTVEYDENDRPVRVQNVVISTQHDEFVNGKELKPATIKKVIYEELIKKVIPAKLLDKKTEILVNPTGKFVIGGPHGDCGRTGARFTWEKTDKAAGLKAAAAKIK